MKKTIISIFASVLILGIALYWLSSQGSDTIAQTGEPDKRKLLALMDRDKNISEEKLQCVREEAKAIQNGIAKYVEEHFPKYVIKSRSFSDPASQGIGRRGQTGFDITWLTTGHTQVSIDVTLAFDEAEAVDMHRRGLEGIAMGDFYSAPDFVGKEGVLVKNILFNKRNTSVGLHFVKGRTIVSTYITNFNRKTEKNEKELIEFVRAIEPLIVAKRNFDDL